MQSLDDSGTAIKYSRCCCKYTPSHSNNEWKGIGIFSLQLCVFVRARTREKGIEYVNAFSKKATKLLTRRPNA